jgi:hypothetical protein
MRIKFTLKSREYNQTETLNSFQRKMQEMMEEK